MNADIEKSVDLENKLDALTNLHDAWWLLQNSREFVEEINLPLFDTAQVDIDKLIVAITQEIVKLRRN